MAEPAYESDELGLSETDKICAVHSTRIAGQPSTQALIDAANKAAAHNEAGDGILESALGLSLEGYRAVERAVKRIPPVRLPRVRRRS